MGSVGIDAKTIGLVFLAGLVYVRLLGLFSFELLFDGRLVRLLMMRLFGVEGGCLSLEIIADLVGKVHVEAGLAVCLEAKGDSCQDLEAERLEFMKDNMWAYANAVSTVCVSDDEVGV